VHLERAELKGLSQYMAAVRERMRCRVHHGGWPAFAWVAWSAATCRVWAVVPR